MKATKHRGIKIVPVKVTRYEVRDLTGKVLAKFSSTSAARAWISGFATANERAMKRAGIEPPAKTPAAKKPAKKEPEA